MATVKEKTAAGITKAKTIWKELVHNRQPDVKKISTLFTRYKAFLKENGSLLAGANSSNLIKEVDMVETLLQQYHQVTGSRDKRFILNDAYVGLMFNVSESIDELTNTMEADASMAVGQ